MELGSELIKKLDNIELTDYNNEIECEIYFDYLMNKKHLNFRAFIYASFRFEVSNKGSDYWFNVANKTI